MAEAAVDNESAALPLLKLKGSQNMSIDDYLKEILKIQEPSQDNQVPSSMSSEEFDEDISALLPALEFNEVVDDERVKFSIEFELKSEVTSYAEKIPIFVRTYIAKRTTHFMDNMKDYNHGKVVFIFCYCNIN